MFEANKFEMSNTAKMDFPFWIRMRGGGVGGKKEKEACLGNQPVVTVAPGTTVMKHRSFGARNESNGDKVQRYRNMVNGLTSNVS